MRDTGRAESFWVGVSRISRITHKSRVPEYRVLPPLALRDCSLQRLGQKEPVPEFLACPSAQKTEKDFKEAAVITALWMFTAAPHGKDVIAYGVCTDCAEGKARHFQYFLSC